MSRVVQIRSVFLCYLAMRIGLDSPHKGSPVRQAAAREDVLDRGEYEFLVRQPPCRRRRIYRRYACLRALRHGA